MGLQQIPGLYIAETEKRGRGVFCARDIEKGELIEMCPLIKIPNKQLEYIGKTVLYDYYFLLDDKDHSTCIALGYGSLYNHSPKPNAEVLMDADAELMYVECLENIQAGSEILISYSGKSKNMEELWFPVH